VNKVGYFIQFSPLLYQSLMIHPDYNPDYKKASGRIPEAGFFLLRLFEKV